MSVAKKSTLAHGVDPQRLFPEIVKRKVWEDRYWKEHLFGVTAETIINYAIKCKYVGGTHGGGRKPTPFICMLLKLCQLAPELEIIFEFIKQDQFKYLRALGVLYLRLVGKSKDVYNYLEPILSDYRKLRWRKIDGTFEVRPMDEFIDELLTKSNLLDIDFPHLPKREILENSGVLGLRPWLIEDLTPEQVEEMHSSAEFVPLLLQRNENGKINLLNNNDSDALINDGTRITEEKTEMTVREWNQLRRKLGLPLLDAPEESEAEEKKRKEMEDEEEERRGVGRKRKVNRDETWGGKRHKGEDDLKVTPGFTQLNIEENRTSLNIDEWNAVRQKMGLKPLK